MQRKGTRRLATVGALLVVVALAAGAALAGKEGDRSTEIKRAIDGGKAKNVILFIGDGMGESEITLARDYALGAAGRFAGLDSLTFTGDATTYSVQETDPTKPDYVPDSAPTASAWATGLKTSNERISTLPGVNTPGNDPKTILELAQEQGLATGNVSTAEITDATPAAVDSHVPYRSCQGPQNMEPCPLYKKTVGGPGSIAEQTVDHGVDVVLGGGLSRFTQVNDGGPYVGQTVLQQAEALGYQVVKNRADMLAADGSKKLLGLFKGGNMTTEWKGTPAEFVRTGPQRCNEANRPSNEPSLAEMTRKAIELLDRKTEANGNGRGWPPFAKKGKKGFFLQVESASIDKQDHVFNPCEQIGETVSFDEAVQAGLAYAAENEDTLVIVSADHSHTSQIIPQTTVSPGRTSILLGADAAPGQTTCVLADDRASTAPGCITVNYATSVAIQTHTGSTVPVLAQGPQAANVLGLNDHTDLFEIMNRALFGNEGEEDDDDDGEGDDD